MTITNSFLNEIAKHINGESGDIPNFLSVSSSTVAAIAATDTALTAEIGSRYSLSGSRANNVVTLSAIRPAADVVNTGTTDTLNVSGLFTQSTGGTLLTGAVHNGITQSTNIDIEFIYEFEVRRG